MRMNIFQIQISRIVKTFIPHSYLFSVNTNTVHVHCHCTSTLRRPPDYRPSLKLICFAQSSRGEKTMADEVGAEVNTSSFSVVDRSFGGMGFVGLQLGLTLLVWASSGLIAVTILRSVSLSSQYFFWYLLNFVANIILFRLVVCNVLCVLCLCYFFFVQVSSVLSPVRVMYV